MSRARSRALGLVLLASCALAGPALAVQDPHAGRFDARVRTVTYNPLNVVRVIGGTFASTEVIFAAGETITQVAIGDADGWLVLPAGNLLFLKPVEVRTPTNAQVVTRRPDGFLRSYQLELVARAASQDHAAEGVQLVVAYAYPGDARQAALAERAKAAAGADEQLAQSRLAVDLFYGPRNWRYTAQGASAVQPLEVSDNGRLTAFRFPGNQTLPTIYTVAPDGQETIVPYTMRDDLAVVSATAREFRLRYGNDVLRVFNLGFDPIGQNPGTGTTTPEVQRSVREARQ